MTDSQKALTPLIVGDVVRALHGRYQKDCDVTFISFSDWIQQRLAGLEFDKQTNEYKVMLECRRSIDAIYYLGNLVRKNIIPIDHLVEYLKQTDV